MEFPQGMGKTVENVGYSRLECFFKWPAEEKRLLAELLAISGNIRPFALIWFSWVMMIFNLECSFSMVALFLATTRPNSARFCRTCDLACPRFRLTCSLDFYNSGDATCFELISISNNSLTTKFFNRPLFLHFSVTLFFSPLSPTKIYPQHFP